MLRLPVLVISLLLLVIGCSRNNDPLARHSGRWLIINYWAEWCKPCRGEIPELNAFSATHKASVDVVGINYDGITGEALQQQATQLGIAFELMATDPAQLGRWLRPQVLPTTLIVDPNGRLVRTLAGPQTQASLTAALEAAR